MCKIIPKLCGLLVFAYLQLGNCTAKAEDQWDILQITCAPELNYFALKTTHIWHTFFGPGSVFEMASRLENQENMYFAEKILSHPYVCTLPSRKVSVEIIGYTVKDHGECSARPFFEVAIKSDGNEVDKFSPFGINPCLADEAHIVEINKWSFQNCTIHDASSPFWEKEKVKSTSCSNKKL